MKKLVLFDFDGVLVNTADIEYRIYKEINENFTQEEHKGLLHGNFVEEWEKGVKEKNYIWPDNFREKYEAELMTITIADVLNEAVVYLASKYKLAIISSTESVSIQRYLKKQNLAEYFDDILGFDVHPSKSVKINKMMEKYSASPENTIFITDTLGDIREANKCNVLSIGITWGQHDRETLQKGNPAAIIDDPTELLPAIEKLIQRSAGF